MKTFYLKHFFKTSLLMLTLLLGTSSWGQTETLTITRSNFTNGALAYGTDDLWTATTSGGDVITGYFDIYSVAGQTTMQTRTNTPVGSYPYNVVAIPGNITKITLIGGGTGSARSWTPYLSTTPLTKSNYTSGESQGAKTASSNSASTVWDISTSENFTYFYLNMTGGAAYLNSITIEYEVPSADPTLSVSTNEITGLDYIFGNGPSDAQSFTLSGTNLDGTEDVMIGLDDGASSDFEISLNATSGYDTDLFIEGYDGTDTEIFVRLKAGKAVGDTYGDIITIFGDNTNEVYVLLLGEVTAIPSVPVVSDAELTGNVGVAFSYQVVATNEPTSYAISSEALPAGLSLDTETGLITGTPTLAGSFITGITATNISGTSDEGVLIFDITEPNFYTGNGVFKRVTDISDLTDGEYVITNSISAFAMSNTYNGTFFDRETAEATHGFIINPSVETVWEINADGAGHTIFNNLTEKYVSYTGSTNNVQAVNAVTANNQRWSIVIDEEGVVKVTNAALVDRRLQYNASSPRFACYTGSQQDLALYKLVESTTWDGMTWSNGTPDNTKVAVFTADYTLSANLDAKDVITALDATLTIVDGTTLTVVGSIVNEGFTTLEDGGNIIQIEHDAVNGGNMLVKKNSSLIKHLDYTAWSSPVAGQDLQAFSPQTLAYRITSYNTTNDTWEPISGNFEAGKGYMFRAPNDFVTTPYIYNGEFNGVPNNGNIGVNFANVGVYQGIGNPYPSNMSTAQFWAANPGTATLYYWTNINAWDNQAQDYVANNWATFSLAGGVAAFGGSKTPTDVIEVGQGFVVETDNILSSVTFDNTMRTSDNGVFFRSATTNKHRMWLNFSGANGQLNQILVGYMDGATNAFDLGIDAKMFGWNGSALYSIIDNEESKFTIQGRAMPFDDYDVVPLGLKVSQAGTYTVSIADIDGIFAENQDIFLKDNLTQTQHNLKEADYTFVSAEGEFLNRFEIVYRAELSVSTPELENTWVVYAKDNNFNIQTQSFDLKDVVVYDMLGRAIYQSAAEGNTHSIANLNSNGVMIVKITTTDGQEFSRKVAK